MLKPTNDYPVFLQNLQYLRVIIFTIVISEDFIKFCCYVFLLLCQIRNPLPTCAWMNKRQMLCLNKYILRVVRYNIIMYMHVFNFGHIGDASLTPSWIECTYPIKH